MEITKQQSGDYAEMKVEGRLDGYWSDHLAAMLDEAVRGGAHSIRLDLGAVDYISSLGISVLMRFHRELRAIGGSLKVFNPSPRVQEVLALSNLSEMLLSRRGSRFESRDGATMTWEIGLPARGAEYKHERAVFELFEANRDATLECLHFGEPSLLRGCRFREAACRTLAIPEPGFALGLGALGQGFEECRDRFGEFLAVAEAAAYLPTDGTNVPDYLLLSGETPPRIQACYGLVCRGELGQLARFEAKRGVGAISLSEIAQAALEWTGRSRLGMVLATESVGLIGAALTRSPAAGEGNVAQDVPFAYPDIRNWITFTAERAFPHCVALLAGVVVRGPCESLAPLVRPLGRDPTLLGHFHAAAFSYRSLPKGPIKLSDTVATLFETERLQGLLHLLSDYRAEAGVGESEFLRGACWLAPIEQVGPLEDKENRHG
jgi:anti-anti-sigma factor